MKSSKKIRGKKSRGRKHPANAQKFSADFMEDGRQQPAMQHRDLIERFSGKAKGGDFDHN